jgi:endonuclease/exonuclease/phosphatase (EEP) superfamily protein YafD
MPRRGAALAAALSVLLAACVTLTEAPRALISEPGRIAATTLPCPAAARAARAVAAAPGTEGAVDPAAIRVVTWNIHKESDAGWAEDLARLVAGSDIVLLQEVTLRDDVQRIIEAARLRWIMASSFIYDNVDIGVLTATRAVPIANCTQRVVEPLLRLPKSSIITWLRLPGSRQTLAVANVHAINFSLSLGTYEEQLAALADALAAHDGPIIVGGDLNTWTGARLDAVRGIAARLRLVEIPFAEDKRSLFFGNQVDHLLVRGLTVVSAEAIPVRSSDHNPVAAVLRLAP